MDQALERCKDLIFLWKQNDSDIYGRRSDMVANAIIAQNKVDRIIHFDAPVNWSDLADQLNKANEKKAHQGAHIFNNTVRRALQLNDEDRILRRVFVYENNEKSLYDKSRFVERYEKFIQQTIDDDKISRDCILWICPLVFDYEIFIKLLKPSLIICDIIDDQRCFPKLTQEMRHKINEGYNSVLKDADLVFSNCLSVSESFKSLNDNIYVVPNGFDLSIVGIEADLDVLKLPKPIIGYVGNLRDRINWPLIERIAETYPNGSVVLVGTSHGRNEAYEVASRHNNVHLFGVKPYHEAIKIIRSFDIAIMPHLKTNQSDSMNPLKMFVYFAAGKRIVASEVANIDIFSGYVSIASSDDKFMDLLRDNIFGWIPELNENLRRYILEKNSWNARIDQMWKLIEAPKHFD